MVFDPTTARPVSRGFDPTTARPVARFPVATNAEIGPIPEGTDVPSGTAQAAEQASAIEGQIPGFQRFTMNAQQHAPLLLGGAAAIATGGASLPISALAGGVGTGGGELVRQRASGEATDLKQATVEGGKAAAFGAGAGYALKGLGALAGKIFRSRMAPNVASAAHFAREQGVPFPMSSAMPTSAAGRIEQGTRLLLPGEIRTQVDANKVAQFLNQNVGTMTEKIAVFDEAAGRGQRFFANIINPNKAGATEAWKTYQAAIGKDTPIPVNSTLAAVREARDALKSAGAVAGQKGDELFTTLDSFLAANSRVRSTQELNLLNSAIVSKGMKGRTKDLADEVVSAIEKDLVGFAEANGSNVGQQFLEGIAARAKYRRLAQVPELERLAGELGAGGRAGTKGTRDWMNTLFTKGNGKALAMIRKEDPELYHELADAWLAQQINQFSKQSSETLVRSLDGPAFRNWFTQNSDNLRSIMTREQFKALDNFTQYAELMGGAVTRAAKGWQPPTALLSRVGAEAYATLKQPLLMVPGEAGSYILARGLSDPNSTLFKLFTEGFSPATKSFMVKAGQISGQAASGKD